MNIAAWNVRSRLTVGFGLVSALLLIIMLIGLASMTRMHDGMTSILDDRIPKMSASDAIANQVDGIAIALRNMMLTDDVADRQKQRDNIVQSRSVVVKNIEVLDKLIVLPKGKELLADLKTQRSKYLSGQEALMALVETDKTDEARQYLSTQLRPVLSAFKTSIFAVAEQQTEQMSLTGVQAQDTFDAARSTMIGLGILALALSAVIGMLITRSLLKELGGEPREAANLARTVAQGDFTHVIALKAGDTQSLMASLVNMQGNLAQIVTTVRHGSEGVATASAEIAQGNNDLSNRTEQQASALEQTAASMEELGSTVKQNADSARQANQLAQSASAVAVQGGVVVNQVVETMKDINDSSRKISDIIQVIDSIAFQTNILALNAAVEAARAGEQGRGFAVVASEVRSLAGRSADAAKEIKTLINASVERVEHGTALVDKAGTTMSEVVDSIKRVTDLMGEISAASNEQSLGVSQVGEAVSQMDQTTQQNAALVEEMAAAAGSLRGQANELVEAVAFFKIGGEHSARPSLAGPPKVAVRSTAPLASAFKGAERRSLGTSHGGASTRAAQPTSSAKPPSPSAATVVPKLPVKAQSKVTPAGGDDDWESF